VSRKTHGRTDDSWLWILVISLAGFVVTALASARWREHVGVLLAHFRSGNWSVNTDSESFEAAIFAKYGVQNNKWAVHYVAGSGELFPLDPLRREASIELLGQSTLSAGDAFLPRPGMLAPGYGSLLAAAVTRLGDQRSKHDRDALQELANAIGLAPIDGAEPAVNLKGLRRANEILSLLQGSHPLRQALDKYATWKRDLGVDFPAFAVATTPPALNESEWIRGALSYPQASKCNGTVQTRTGSEAAAVPATIAVVPRAIDVGLNRPWLSDTFADDAAANPVYQKFFAPGGALHLIPMRLWIRMEDLIQVEFSEDDRRNEVRTWIRAGECCTIHCDSTKLALQTESVIETTTGAVEGRVEGQQPVLFAIISRVRNAGAPLIAASFAGEHQ
jgi:hypothetical protein